ncbi:hypothetical protein MUO32_11185 [Shinella sp. CPCC 101442]|uniref:hypothetical protein n=1 Tax=Shinella sp. CPCC 101442 TaxID=2932265 RepID=UPI0021531D4C|nr:hypothetical protein [Shinella sp. CPCC 101442]MCR6499599.1 hypothetical protein [Shinella sp. CPCC 101442]
MTLASGIEPRFSIIAGSYFVAVVVASLVVVTSLAITVGIDPSLSLAFVFGCAVTFAYGLPGFIATVLISRCFHLRGWRFFIIAGGLDGVLSMAIFDYNMPKPDKFFFLVILGGLAGGFIYRLLAYRPHLAAT